eukprot:1141674-Pelagomonas_calceolata.AAC.1
MPPTVRLGSCYPLLRPAEGAPLQWSLVEALKTTPDHALGRWLGYTPDTSPLSGPQQIPPVEQTGQFFSRVLPKGCFYEELKGQGWEKC